MVVVYPAPTEGNICTCLWLTPTILLRCHGSIVPKLLPQCLVTLGLSCFALYYNPLTEILPADSQPQDAYVVIGFLVCFLTFFKTQAAYAEFVHAMDYVEDVLHHSRRIGVMACTIVDWEADEAVRGLAMRILRLVVLQYFVITEYLTRTGPNATDRRDVKDRLREDIRHTTGIEEFKLLYPGEADGVPGSESHWKTANPLQVTMWIQMLFCICQKKGAILTAPALNVCADANMGLYKAFCGLNRIDKTQFPFPYAQLVKLLNFIYVFTNPFVLEPSCGYLTPFAMVLVAIGFFGCEEVAEILASPFGTDDNDIDLKYYGKWLIRDLEVVWKSREEQAQWLSGGIKGVKNFSEMLENLGYNRSLRSNNLFGSLRASNRKRSTSDTSSTSVAETESVIPGSILTRNETMMDVSKLRDSPTVDDLKSKSHESQSPTSKWPAMMPTIASPSRGNLPTFSQSQSEKDERNDDDDYW